MVRPVEVLIKYDFPDWVSKGAGKGTHLGKFHGFFTEGDTDNGIVCVAAVELSNGEVIMVSAERISFLDVPAPPSVVVVSKQADMKGGE